MQLHIFLSIHINHNISLISDKSPKTAILWQRDKSVCCLFLGGGRKKIPKQNKIFSTISVYCLSLHVPSQSYMKQQSVYLFLHSVCQCGLWYHRVFAETPQLNLRVVIHRRQNCPDLWMKNILNCPGQLMHCQFYKEKKIYIFLCRDITGVGFTVPYKYIFKWQSQMYFPVSKKLFV